MLKIRTFILALSLTPLLALNWQTTSPAQTSPSGGSAGSLSGGNAGSLSGGNAGGLSGGGINQPPGNTVTDDIPGGNAGGQSGADQETANNGNPDENTSASGGNAGGQSGAGNETANNGNPDENTSASGGNAGGQSGAGNETANNADNGGNNNEGNNENPSGSGETLIPRASSIRIIRTAAGRTIRIRIRSVQRKLNEAAFNLLNSNNSGVLVALLQGGSIGQTASDNLTNFLSNAGVNADLGNNLRVILSRIAPNQGNADVDINQLNNAINTYNQIIQQSSPVTLQALSQSQDFVAIGKALKELRTAVN
ncbi:MAG: hypothetical protein HEQ24_13815 [Dolichospermum sp. BR01]|nr:hypothetical protein [Dolichospermum sp. BR01]